MSAVHAMQQPSAIVRRHWRTAGNSSVSTAVRPTCLLSTCPKETAVGICSVQVGQKEPSSTDKLICCAAASQRTCSDARGYLTGANLHDVPVTTDPVSFKQSTLLRYRSASANVASFKYLPPFASPSL